METIISAKLRHNFQTNKLIKIKLRSQLADERAIAIIQMS